MPSPNALHARVRVVLIGEASHGTQDFYAMRADVTRRLVTAHGFRAVALEADWPDTSRAHRYVTGRSDDASAMQALGGSGAFPQWMLCGDAWCGIVRRRGRRSADRPAPAGACTDALRPLDLWAGWDEGEPPETWPSTL